MAGVVWVWAIVRRWCATFNVAGGWDSGISSSFRINFWGYFFSILVYDWVVFCVVIEEGIEGFTMVYNSGRFGGGWPEFRGLESGGRVWNGRRKEESFGLFPVFQFVIPCFPICEGNGQNDFLAVLCFLQNFFFCFPKAVFENDKENAFSSFWKIENRKRLENDKENGT